MVKKCKQWQTFLGSKVTAQGDSCHEIKRCLLLGRKAMTNLDSILRNRDITLLTKIHIIKATGFFPVVIYQCENWTIKKAECQKLMLLNCGVGEDSWESLDSKEIKPVNPKGNKPWIFIGRIDAEAEAPILWPPDVNSPFLEKDTDAGKNWRHEEKGTTEDKMVRWNYQFNEQEFEQTERQWRTGKPKMLQSMGSQRVRHNWVNNYMYICTHTQC